MTEPKVMPPWLDRLYKFASTLPKSKAADLATDLESFKSDLEEIMEVLEELIPNLETWDESEDRESRAEAKEASDTGVNELHGLLSDLVKAVGPVNDPA